MKPNLKQGIAGLSASALSLLLVACAGSPAPRYHVVPTGTEAGYRDFHYAEAVRQGDGLFVSGQVGEGKDIESQTRSAFQNLEKVLKASGASLRDVVRLRTYHTHMAEFSKVPAIKDQFFPDHYPAWTVLGVNSLVFPELLIEIEADVVVGSGARRTVVSRVEK